MKIDYKPLMARTDIPWHNPGSLTPDQVDPHNAGWRLCVAGEVPEDAQICTESETWNLRYAYQNEPLHEACTYRTIQPLPEAYRHLLEPDYSSKEHQRNVLTAAFDGLVCEALWPIPTEENPTWTKASLLVIANAIVEGRSVRIAPEKKRVPLDDYRASEAVSVDGRVCVVTYVHNGVLRIDCDAVDR